MIFISYIKKHWAAITLAIFVGLVILLPTVLSIEKIGLSNFKGIYKILNDDEDYYMTLTREVYDGHISLSNPYIKEHKTGLYLFPPVPEMIYSGVAKVLNISVATVAIINDFFLPAISVLLLYALFLKITEESTYSKNISLALSALFFLFFISSFNRPISPQFNFIFLLLGLNLIWIIVTNRHKVKNIFLYNLLLSVIFGILVYAYPFYWMTLGVVYTIWTFSVSFIDKDFKYWLKNWLSFFIPAFIFSIPFLLNDLSLRSSPLFAETNLRLGFINTHIPGSFFNVGLMLLLLPVSYLVWKLSKNKTTALFPGVLILSGIILNWQNVITGQTLQFPPHFYPVMVLFIFLVTAISISTLGHNGVNNLSNKYKILCLILFVILIYIFYKQRGEIINAWTGISSPADVTSLEKIREPLRWLEENTPMDSSIYVLGGDYNWAVTIYTHDNVYFSPNAGLSLMSDDELENRWVIQHFFDNVKAIDINGNREIWANKFIDTYQNKESRIKIEELITGRKYPPAVLMDQKYVNEVLEKNKQFQEIGFEKALKTYNVDYVLIDKSDVHYTNLPILLKKYQFLEPVYSGGNIMIYKVI